MNTRVISAGCVREGSFRVRVAAPGSDKYVRVVRTYMQ